MASGARRSKPANQGSAGTPKIQKPRTSGAQSNKKQPLPTQTHRGFHSGGQGGSAKAGPKPFK